MRGGVGEKGRGGEGRGWRRWEGMSGEGRGVGWGGMEREWEKV